MKHFNSHLIENKVSTQYNDLNGNIAFDQQDNILDLLSSNDIDPDRYWILGVGFADGGIEGLCVYGLTAKFLLLDKEEYRADNYQELRNLLSDCRVVNVIEKTFRIDYTEFFKYFKRVDCMTLTDINNYIQDINIIGE